MSDLKEQLRQVTDPNVLIAMSTDELTKEYEKGSKDGQEIGYLRAINDLIELADSCTYGGDSQETLMIGVRQLNDCLALYRKHDIISNSKNEG